MALRTKIAKKILTKAEQRHLTEFNIHSLRDLRRQGDFMKKLNPDDPGQICRECQHIINKLANADN